MALTWSNTGKGPEILERLDALTSLNEDGAVSLGWDGHFDTLIEILAGYITFSREVPTIKRTEIARRAVTEAKKDEGIGAAAVLSRAEAAQREFLRTPLRRFVLLTSASMRHGDYLRPLRIGGDTISFVPFRPKTFPIPSGGSLRVTDNTPSDFTYIKAHVSAREPLLAGQIAFDRVDLFRSIWNLVLNSRTSFRVSGGTIGYKPVNKIIPGPTHTLHFPDGRLALKGRWWYTVLPQQVWAKDWGKEFESLKSKERFVRKQIARCTFSSKLTDLLIRYGRALDEHDLYNSLLRLWAVLEDITGTPKGSYDVLVRRASFLSYDPPFSKLLLEHLRESRNQIVHAGAQPSEVERLLYQLKSFVETGIWFLLYRVKEFERIEDFWSLLDIPSDMKVLRKRIRQHKLALTLHSQDTVG